MHLKWFWSLLKEKKMMMTVHKTFSWFFDQPLCRVPWSPCIYISYVKTSTKWLVTKNSIIFIISYIIIILNITSCYIGKWKFKPNSNSFISYSLFSNSFSCNLGFLGQVPGGLQMPMGPQMGQMQMMFPGGNPMIMMPPRFR